MKYTDEASFFEANVFGLGESNARFAQYFTGQSFLNPLTDAGVGEFPFFNVSFEPGYRNNWHIHHATSGGGQILICTAGEGIDAREVRVERRARDVSPPAHLAHGHALYRVVLMISNRPSVMRRFVAAAVMESRLSTGPPRNNRTHPLVLSLERGRATPHNQIGHSVHCMEGDRPCVACLRWPAASSPSSPTTGG